MATPNQNINKFLALIRFTEGTDRYPDPYRVLFGGGTFTDMGRHPNIVVTKSGYSSTAAGAYQFLKKTYDSLGMKNMSPAEQDRGAVELIKRRGAYADVLAGRWEAAIQKCNKEWASFPGSPYGQPTKSMAVCLAFLGRYGAAAAAAGNALAGGGGTGGTAVDGEKKKQGA